MTTTKYALILGLNSVNPSSYGGWNGLLSACENDAIDMQGVCRVGGFSENNVKLLLGREVRGQAVADWILGVSKVADVGDLVLIYYSGHGGQVRDSGRDELDGLDETWCLWDGQLIDDSLFSLLEWFRVGVKIVLISDSCHSGTVYKSRVLEAGEEGSSLYKAKPWGVEGQFTELSLEERLIRGGKRRIKGRKRASYTTISKNTTPIKEGIEDYILLLSGCQDNQFSMDGAKNGAFTGVVLDVLRGNRGEQGYLLSYDALHRTVVSRMPPTQTPGYVRSVFGGEGFLS